jgi:hypothetical protein
VNFILLITLDRLFAVKFPFGEKKILPVNAVMPIIHRHIRNISFFIKSEHEENASCFGSQFSSLTNKGLKQQNLYESVKRQSGHCTTAGILATISSEASVNFILLITLDRLFAVKFPFGDIKITKKIAIATTCVTSYCYHDKYYHVIKHKYGGRKLPPF